MRSADGPAILYGWHTVKAALENPNRRIIKLVTTENAARRLSDDGVTLPIAPELVRPDIIAARLPPDAVHQGLYAEVLQHTHREGDFLGAVAFVEMGAAGEDGDGFLRVALLDVHDRQ